MLELEFDVVPDLGLQVLVHRLRGCAERRLPVQLRVPRRADVHVGVRTRGCDEAGLIMNFPRRPNDNAWVSIKTMKLIIQCGGRRGTRESCIH